MDILNWLEYESFLVKLAKRKYPKTDYFYNIIKGEANISGCISLKLKCLICEKIIDCNDISNFRIINEHGYNHLVELNLIPFI